MEYTLRRVFTSIMTASSTRLEKHSQGIQRFNFRAGEQCLPLYHCKLGRLTMKVSKNLQLERCKPISASYDAN